MGRRGEQMGLTIERKRGGDEINFLTFIIEFLISVSQEGFLGLGADWFPVYLHYNKQYYCIIS